jgi:hypothetical protein
VNANEWNPSETLFEFAHWCSEQAAWGYDMSINSSDDIYQAIHEFGIAKGLTGVSEEWKRGQDIAA